MLWLLPKGHIEGEETAAETAIRHPDRVDELVLVDAAGITSATISESPIGERFARVCAGCHYKPWYALDSVAQVLGTREG